MAVSCLHCRPLPHSKSKVGLTFLEAPSLSRSPKGRQPTGINRAAVHKFQAYCWVAYTVQPPPLYLAQSLAPSPWLSQEGGPGSWPRSHIMFYWAINAAQHREQQVLSLPATSLCGLSVLNSKYLSPASSHSPPPSSLLLISLNSGCLQCQAHLFSFFSSISAHPSPDFLQSNSHSFAPWCVSMFVQHSQPLSRDFIPTLTALLIFFSPQMCVFWHLPLPFQRVFPSCEYIQNCCAAAGQEVSDGMMEDWGRDSPFPPPESLWIIPYQRELWKMNMVRDVKVSLLKV